MTTKKGEIFMKNNISQKWLDLNQVSYIVNESVSTLRRRLETGQLKATQRQNRGKYLIHIDDVNQYMGLK